MDFERYTERSRGFVQAAQTLALRGGHQRLRPEHLLKVLLDDNEGLASGLIDRAGGNSRAILKATEDALNKLPKVSGSGAGQVYLAPELARAFDAADIELASLVLNEPTLDDVFLAKTGRHLEGAGESDSAEMPLPEDEKAVVA